jgi:anaerobic magnesium-protoporphyrin IX monomethyl ester cyclase
VRIGLVAIHLKPVFLPLAPMYLKAALVASDASRPDDVEIVEIPQDASVQDAVAMVAAVAPDIVGLSCYVWNVLQMMELARHLRQARPGVKIVIGGPEVGPVAEDLLAREPAIDVVVRGEGERPMVDLVAAWTADRPLTSVPGIACRVNGKVEMTPDAAIVALDDLASPHTELCGGFAGRVISIETQRGCVFRCNFCFYNKDLSIRNRRFSLERVQREIRFWLDRDIRGLYLMDPVFNLNANRAKEICRFLARENTRRVPVHAEIWAEFVDAELADLMAAAGVTYLEVGLQTTDEAVLANVERRLRMAPFLEGLAHLDRARLRYELQLIYGLPGETPESFARALDFAGAINPPRLSIFMLMVLPGTELWRKAEALGLKHDPTPPYYVRSHSTMTKEHISHGWSLIRGHRQLRRSVTARLLSRWPGLGLTNVVTGWVAHQGGCVDGDEPDQDALNRYLRVTSRASGIPSGFVEPLLTRDRAGHSAHVAT